MVFGGGPGSSQVVAHTPSCYAGVSCLGRSLSDSGPSVMQVFPVLGVDLISPEFRLGRQVGVSHTSRRTNDTEDAVHHARWMISSLEERSSHVSK